MPYRPAPLTRRLLAALETHAHEDTGPVGLADWAALSSLFDRELQLVTRLAGAVDAEDAAQDPGLQDRAAALQRRYQGRARVLSDAAQQLAAEQQTLTQTRRRTRAIGQAYAAR